MIQNPFLSLILATSIALPGMAQAPTRPQAAPDSALPSYKPVPGISGSFSTCGSDSMEGLVISWISNFKKAQPGCNITFLGRTSDAAVADLTQGATPMAAVLREMSRAELDAFVAKWHYQPTRIWVAVNPIAVYVNSNNPILSLSIDQLDAIYSTTRKAGAKASIETWGDLGLMRDWANRRVTPYSRDEGTATRSFMQSRILLKGEFKPNVIPLQDHTALLEVPIVDVSGVAVTSLDDPAPGTKIVPLAPAGGQKACLPTPENVLKGDYPLARFFYIYLNRAPGKPIPPVAQSFITFILSKEGQQIALGSHQIPVSAEIAQAGLSRLQ